MLRQVKKLVSNTARSFGYYVGILPPPTQAVESHVAMLFEIMDVNCLIDVGAHYGEYATRMRKGGYTGRIVSYEPVTENYNILKEKCANDDDWIVHHAALADVPGKMTINVTVGTETSSFLEPSEYGKRQFGGRLKIKGTENVQVRTIDEIYDDCTAGLKNPKVYLKVDAQGYDMKVIEGAKDKLDLLAGLQTEMYVQPFYNGTLDYKTCIEKLVDRGFALSGIFPVRVDHGMKLMAMDCIMVRNA